MAVADTRGVMNTIMLLHKWGIRGIAGKRLRRRGGFEEDKKKSNKSAKILKKIMYLSFSFHMHGGSREQFCSHQV